MIDPGDVLDPMLAEVKRVLLEMKKTKDLGQRKMQSEIVKNLCESLGVFFDTMASAMAGDIPDFLDEDDGDDEIF